MQLLRRLLMGLRAHKVWVWFGLILYAALVTFPHQKVQDVVGAFAVKYTLKRLYQISATLALIEGALVVLIFAWAVSRQTEWRRLVGFQLLSFGLMVATWWLFTANNTELVHYPQYFPEGMVLMALTLSPIESLGWLTIFGGLDEAFQYTFLVAGRELPYDFNDIYMDLVGGAAGIIFAMAVLGCERRKVEQGWVRRILTRPGIVAILGVLAAGFVLWASGKMVLYEAPGLAPHWFAVSRLKTVSFWYFSPVILGPHHFHELSPLEGPVLILVTIAIYGVLDKKLKVGARAEQVEVAAAPARGAAAG
jgi:hypothetical protein